MSSRAFLAAPVDPLVLRDEMTDIYAHELGHAIGMLEHSKPEPRFNLLMQPNRGIADEIQLQSLRLEKIQQVRKSPFFFDPPTDWTSTSLCSNVASNPGAVYVGCVGSCEGFGQWMSLDHYMRAQLERVEKWLVTQGKPPSQWIFKKEWSTAYWDGPSLHSSTYPLCFMGYPWREPSSINLVIQKEASMFEHAKQYLNTSMVSLDFEHSFGENARSNSGRLIEIASEILDALGIYWYPSYSDCRALEDCQLPEELRLQLRNSPVFKSP